MTPLPCGKAAINIKPYAPSTLKTLSAVALLSLAMVGCGGSGGGVTLPSPNPPPPQPPPSSGLAQSSQYEQQCSATTGTPRQERQWVRSYVDEAYLWYNEIPKLDPVTSTATPQNFFSSLTTQGVPSKDRFSFTFNTAQWNLLSQSGITAGYGVQWAAISLEPPRLLRVAYSEPNSPASQVNLQRGATILAVNGVDINTTTTAGIDTLNNGIFRPTLGASTSFLVQDVGSATTRTVQMTAANVTSTPVPRTLVGDVGGVRFGYLLFNDHIATAEAQLISAVNQLKTANIQELVLDLRYNGGGYLYIASQLGYMLATPNVAGRTFEKLRYNDKRVADNSEAPFPFFSTQSISGSNGLPVNFNGPPLPQLGLSRVYVITTGDTCSASEAIMNSLRPFVSIVQIGSTTCGKPYGFTAKDNCGTSYFPIEFEGVNDAGQGGYSNGFAPNSGVFQGCSVSDDFDRQLGDTNERMLGAAITHRLTGSCPAVIARKESAVQFGKVLVKDPARENKILLSK
jgi:carboxyl-terminal processing protease